MATTQRVLTWNDIKAAFNNLCSEQPLLHIHSPEAEALALEQLTLLKNVLIVTKPVFGNILEKWADHTEYLVKIVDGAIPVSRSMGAPKVAHYASKITVEKDGEFDPERALKSG
jgi:hypothetical protein